MSSSSRATSCPQARARCPRAFYTDPAYFERELDALFRSMWICAGRAEEIARPGQFVLRDVAGDSVIVTRSPDGRVHAFHNVCRHRGTRLCTEATGQFSGSIQCPYHAWTYGLDGRLVGAPHMDEVPHFRKEDYPLHRVAVEIWDGHLFLNLNRHSPDAPRRWRSSSPIFPASSARGAWRISAWAAGSSTTSRPTGS